MRYLVLVVALALVPLARAAAPLPRIVVSADGRHFVTENGAPFFYLGDTAWGLFTQPRADVDLYLADRAKKKFTVIQAVIGFWGSLDRANPDGHPLFLDGDAAKPNPKFFEHVDYVVAQAEAHGLRIAFVPIWSRGHANERNSVLNEVTSRSYGKFLGQRYRDNSVFWLMGGDWTPTKELHAWWRAMAAGLAEGEGAARKHLKTYHTRSPESSSFWYHDDAWLDFNMLQTGHSAVANRNYELIDDDYDRTPVKPVIDGEAAYENIDDRSAPSRVGAATVRWQAWCAVFAGGAGHTYGADSVYGFRNNGGNVQVPGGLPWREALHLPASTQMQHLRALIESRPMLQRIPDQWLIVDDPKSMADRIQACRAADGSYALFYTASGRPFTARLRLHRYDKVSGERIRCWWFNPRDGQATLIDERARVATNDGDRGRDDITMRFTPPTSGPGEDWVLVIDDVARQFPAPGVRSP